jgi:TonB family protein
MAHASPLETRVRSILDSKINRGAFSRLGMVLLLSSLTLITASIAAIGVTFAVPLPPALAKPPALPETSFEELQRARIGDGAAILNPTVAPPQVVRSAQPPYTRDAFTGGIEGTVTIEASIDARGNASVLRTVKGLGYGLDENAARALAGWKFIPALRNGIPVEAITQVDVDFVLANDQSMNASLSGAVSFAGTGVPLAGILVTAATEPGTDVVASHMTDDSGTYRFASLKPGTYRVQAEHVGFESASFTAPLHPEQAVRLNFALEERKAPTVVGTGLQFRVDGFVVLPPRVTYRVEPKYTEEARAARIQGTVVLETSIAADGSVESVQVRRSLGFGLDESAMDSLKQWKFAPATRSGQPVPVSLNIEVNFALK